MKAFFFGRRPQGRRDKEDCMAQRVDLNADMGESFGPWVMGNDKALLDIVTSANIACGMHAGDWDVMSATMQAAKARGVHIGCHPGFNDLQGFGRQRLKMSHESLGNLVSYQLGASLAMAMRVKADVRHLKLHGAMANMAAENEDMARAAYTAALEVKPDIVIFVIAGTAQQRAVEELGCAWAGEIFADRAYNDDATLVDRSLPGAVIHDADEAADRVLAMVRAGALIARSGAHIPTQVDTVCMHGDTPEAIAIARTVRARLEEASIEIGF
jgi:UPF0271 protein